MDFLSSIFGRSGFLPHGYCFTWSPGLLWSMVGADAAIAAAYFSIPAAIVSFVRKRGEPGINRVALLFSAFIFACGTTHVMDVWTIWQPDYGLQAVTKTVTAAISMLTAVMLWRLIPAALKTPTVQRLQSTIGSLEAEIGKRREAERRVVDIQQSLAVTLDSIGAGFVATDQAGNVTRMNAVAERLLGWTQAEASGQRLWNVFDREDRPAEYAAMNPVDLLVRLGIGVETVQRIVAISRDGRHTEIDVQAALTHAEDGSVSGLAMVFRDVTRLARAEAGLRFTLESAHIGDWDLDLATGVVRHSLRHDQCFGYKEAQTDWSFDKFIEHVHPDDREEVSQTFHVAVTELRPWRIQCRVIWPDNSLHWISAHGNVQRNGDKATRMLGIVSEITEQRQAEDARLKAQRLEVENRQIQEANRLKSQFLANMSHELRTPLNAVIGFADLLHSGYVKPDSPKHHEFLGHIGTSGRHLLQLINDVLDLSKVESGKFDFFAEPIDLTALLKEVTDILHTAVQRKDIDIVIDVDPSLTDLKLDPARLKQVLYNYLSNAIKFSATGSHIDVRVSPEGPDHFRIEVEDTGIGISAADLQRLFTEFQQLDTGYSKQHQGTGLGLALTRRLVEAQGGSVGVRSTLGRGSVFHVVLNRIDGFDTRRTEVALEDARDIEAQRVLVIEDDEHGQALLVAAFSDAGFEVDATSDGPYAVRRARDTAYAALTLDLHLPDQRGLALLESIRSHGASHAAPVVGIAMPGNAETAATFAIANVLCKPIRSDEILSAMTRFRLPEGGRANVMVIDDEPSSLDLMQATLKSIGIDAVCFLDGRVALRQIARHRPDAIVLDLMMPEFDGFQVLDALQRLPAWRHVPVFVWTSMLLTDEEYAILARSARAILVKGGGAMEDMLNSIRRWRLPPTATQQAAVQS